MTDQDYKKALQSARQELEQLLSERETREARIASLKQTIDGLSLLCNEPTNYATDITAIPLASLLTPGVTEAIRSVLYHSKTRMSAPEIRDAISQKVDMSGWANELAVIHNTLNRLERQDEVKAVDKRWQLTLKGRTVFDNEGIIARLVGDKPLAGAKPVTPPPGVAGNEIKRPQFPKSSGENK